MPEPARDLKIKVADTLGGRTLASQPLTEETVAKEDCVMILTAHPGVDYRMIVRQAVLVFDARGITAGLDAPNVLRL